MKLVAGINAKAQGRKGAEQRELESGARPYRVRQCIEAGRANIGLPLRLCAFAPLR
jgi:hypothetical protein